MATEKLENLPKKTPEQETYYRVMLRVHGRGKKGKEKVNAAWLEEYNVEDTRHNRKTLNNRYAHIAKEPEFLNSDTFFKEKQNHQQDNDIKALDAFLEEAKNVSPDTFDHILKIYEMKLKLYDHEAKLHGLYKNETTQDIKLKIDTDSAEEKQLSDAQRAAIALEEAEEEGEEST